MSVDPEQLAELEQALRSLDPRDREIFLAHRLDSMSYGQIAQATGPVAEQVEQAIARAMLGIDRHLCPRR